MLPTDYQNFIFTSRYARYNDDEHRRETWQETVGRYFNFMEEHLAEQHDFKLEKSLRARLENSVLSLKVMPSMRALATAGPALKRDNTAGYNCSYLPIDSPRSFDELFYILLCGTGVGYSVERQYINELPVVNEHFEKSSTVITVDDSKAGWARALRELIAMLYVGQVPSWDLAKIRPAGARLKTFGGRASGPGPLNDLLNYTVNLFKGAAGRRLNSLECHDLCCKIASVVVVGGVRRAAQISLSNLSDQRMREAKSGDWYRLNPDRAFANNSVAYTEKPDMQAFMNEWMALYMSHSGERGIFNRTAAKQKAKQHGRRKADFEFGANPCVTGNTPILTRLGYFPIKHMVGRTVPVWNGKEWSCVTPFSTGTNPVVTVHLSDGSSLTCTPYHKFILKGNRRVEVRNLEVGDALEKFSMPFIGEGLEYDQDAYSQGFYSGDGNTDLDYSFLYAPKYVCRPHLCGTFVDGSIPETRVIWKHGTMRHKTFVPLDGSGSYCLRWLAGILDSDGTVTRDKNGNGLQITSVSKNFLLDIKLMLSRLGCNAKVVKGHDKRTKSMPDGRGGHADYECQATWRLLIGNMDTYNLITAGLRTHRLQLHANKPQRDARQFVRVVEIVEHAEPVETFCFTEPKNNSGTFNGIVTGNCGEIILRPFQFCNLSEVIVRADDTEETLKDKIEAATILGTFQSTLTNFKYLRKIWKQNTEEERLLGVSLTGVFDNPLLATPNPHLLERLREHAVNVNKEWAEKLGINQSVAVTTVKPSGTVSQLVNAASGLHPRYAKYYIRRVRADNKDPLTVFMQKAGIPYELCAYKPESTVVFSFPVAAEQGTSMFRDDIDAIKHLELWKAYRQYWCEHNPSVTIQVKENEWMKVGAWVYENFEHLTGVSFLPYDSGTYTQAPYEEIDEAQYQTLLAKMPTNIDWKALAEFEKEDNTGASREMACVGDVCEIVDIKKE